MRSHAQQLEPASVLGLADESRHMPALDGLRAVAIVLVLLYHLTPGHNSDQGLKSALFKVADLGWSGVDMFFVLSGFLITNILLRAKAGCQPLWHFAARRAARILPAHYVALCVVFLLMPAVSGPYDVPAALAQAPYWLYASNYLQAESIPLADQFLLSHFWSLAVEMQFYLLWPFVIYFLRPKTVLRLGLVALLVILAARATAVALDAHWTVNFGWTPLRMGGLIVGASVALALQAGLSLPRMKPMALVIGAAGLLFSATVAWYGWAGSLFKGDGSWIDLTLRTSLPVVMAVFFGALLVLGLQDGVLSKVLGHPVWRPLARYSYGIYIWHFLLKPQFDKSFSPALLSAYVGEGNLSIYLYFVLSSACSMMLAMASYHLIEVHFLRPKKRSLQTPQ